MRKFLTVSAIAIVSASGAFAVEVNNVGIGVADITAMGYDTGVPDGIQIHADLSLSSSEVASLTQSAAEGALDVEAAEVCAEGAAIVVAAGLGPEDPFADVAAGVFEGMCTYSVSSAITYATQQACANGVSARIVVSSELTTGWMPVPQAGSDMWCN